MLVFVLQDHTDQRNMIVPDQSGCWGATAEERVQSKLHLLEVVVQRRRKSVQVDEWAKHFITFRLTLCFLSGVVLVLGFGRDH